MSTLIDAWLGCSSSTIRSYGSIKLLAEHWPVLVIVRDSQGIAKIFVIPRPHNYKSSNCVMCNLSEGDSCEVLSSDGLTIKEGFTRVGNIEDFDNLKGVSGSGKKGLMPYLSNNKELVRFVHPLKLIYKLL